MLEPVTKSIAKLTTPVTVNPSTSAVTPKQEPIKKEEEDGSESSNQPEEEQQSEPTTIKEEEPDDLYQEALAMVPRKLRDWACVLVPITLVSMHTQCMETYCKL